ncbi:MAG TPA: NADH-quinone oxidoreductase subunit L [Pirellulales bacterium]|nr:NADH-quinone oxidoreductase subunit L [Pirellulales bacterium]
MSDIETLLILIPGLPLAACLITALFGASLLRERSHWPVVAAVVGSFICSLFLLSAVSQLGGEGGDGGVGIERVYTLWNWVDLKDAYQLGANGPQRAFDISVSLRADPLTAIMLSMVTFVSSLVVIYASGYMHGDRGYWRFFTYVALFIFSMTMLVSVSSFVLLFVFWEAVGLCSYLLVGFWYEKPAAAAAGKKAFLVNRVGDFGFLIGLFLIWTTYGTLNFHDVNAQGAPAAVGEEVAVEGVLGQARLAKQTAGYVGGAVGVAICLCLLAGACGKSAQFPLHVWLPDAMEGPTPVSALIHAATMVTAGVYMFTRVTPLVVAAPTARAVVAVVGCFTALLAGLIALTQNDLKRVMAYSTISQLGYMFLGVGVGTLAGITAGMFHLFTHAFFKALLFLGSGSVMHAMGGVIDMTRFSGLRRVMPWTCLTFASGCLALCGVFPFAGYWSKDAILAAAYEAHHGPLLFAGSGWEIGLYQVLYYAGIFTAFLTAVYTFRAFFMTFFGDTHVPREAGHHAHEAPPAMLVPLIVLAVCALGIGLVNSKDVMGGHGFYHFLEQTPSLAYAPIERVEHSAEAAAAHDKVAMTSLIAAFTGIGLAAFLYLGGRREVEAVGKAASSARIYGLGLYQLSYNRFFIDAIYNILVIWPLWLLALISYWFDRWVIDGLVNLVGKLPVAAGSLLRSLQNGMVQFYALAMMLGMLVLVGTLLMWPAQ